jgi:tetratricopeptide (TPR) repeat protein
LWSADGKPGENTEEIVRVLESVLAREPLHAGANHYYIHAMEASPAPDRALPSAQRLETMVPKAGHLVHMPAHIYARVGNFSGAAESNARAIDADVAYAAEAEKTGSMYDLMYHSHNEHFLAYAASMEGRYAEAKRAGDALQKRLLPHAQMMPMLDFFLWTPIWVDLRFAKWEAILARPEPASKLKISHLMWRYSRAMAYAVHKEIAKADAEQALFTKEAGALPADISMSEMNPPAAVLAVANETLAARLAAARGDSESAIRHWSAAAEAQDKLNYDEPPDWYYPVRESLGAALLANGKAKEAETVFREDLRRNPRNPRSLFGLKESLAAQHADSDAEWVERQFRETWKNADVESRSDDL